MTPGKWRNTALSALFEYLVQLLFPVVFLVEAELEGSLERIQHLRPGIDGFVVSVLLDHLHVLQGVQYLGDREAAFRFQLSLKYPVDQQRPVADREMGADMLLRRHVDRSRAELRLPDPEGLLDLPPLLVHGKDLLRRPVQGRRDGVEAVEAFLLPDSLPVDLVPADLGGLRVLRDMRGLDPSSRVVRAFPPFLEVRAQQLLRTAELLREDALLVQVVLDGERDVHGLLHRESPGELLPPVFHHDLLRQREVLVDDVLPDHPLLFRGELFPAVCLVGRLLHRLKGSGAVVRQEPPVPVLPDGFQLLPLPLLEGLRDDVVVAVYHVERAVLIGSEPGVRAVDEAGRLVFPDPSLLQRDDRVLLAVASVAEAVGDGDALLVREQAHLDDGVRPVLLACPVAAETPLQDVAVLVVFVPVLRLGLEIEVRAVVVEDGVVGADPFLGLPVELPLQPVRGLVQAPEEPVGIVEAEAVHAEEAVQVLDGALLGAGAEDSRGHQPEQYAVAVVFRLRPVGRDEFLPAEAVEDLLQIGPSDVPADAPGSHGARFEGIREVDPQVDVHDVAGVCLVDLPDPFLRVCLGIGDPSPAELLLRPYLLVDSGRLLPVLACGLDGIVGA